jgi:hypothetical protein
MPFPEQTRQKAAKEYICPCTTPILKGEEYVKIVIPPWKQIDGDADDEGKTIAFIDRSQGWTVARYHICCALHVDGFAWEPCSHYEAKYAKEYASSIRS